MTFTASSLIAEARSIADLENSKNVTYQDQVNFLNQAWRDLYSKYTESDGDYWVSETVIQLSQSYADPNSQNGYFVPLPADFYKLRSVSWNNGTIWQVMDKFAIAQRDNWPTLPQYRLKNSQLWVITPQGMTPQIKVDYYIPPATITLPQDPLTFLPAVPVYLLPDYRPGDYVEEQGLLVYIIDSTKTIHAISQRTGVDSLLYTSANTITTPRYYGGYIYFLDTVAGALYRAPTNFTSTLVPVALIASGVTSFNLDGGFIYYSMASATTRINMDGTGAVSVLAAQSTSYQLFGGLALYINAGGFVVYNGVVSTQTATKIMQFAGVAYIHDSNAIKAISFSAAFALTVGVTLLSNVLAVGQTNSSGYAAIRTDLVVEAFSLIVDYSFSYPTNEVNEIMAYSCAYAFARKSTDEARMAAILPTFQELEKRFWSVQKQDEYEFSRINNFYRDTESGWYY